MKAREITEKELEKFDFYLIGQVRREIFYPAIIGLAKDESHIAYSFDLLAEAYMKDAEWSWEEAVEWIDYNLIRALPYYGEKLLLFFIQIE